MEGFEAIQSFFCSMHCSECNTLLQPDGITLLKEEQNYFVVKITCTKCNQPVGLAIVGIEHHVLDAGSSYESLIEETEISENEAPSITYDDVIDAHHFFNNLGSDWMKHIEGLSKVNTESDDDG
ncbi:MAG: hypothetical protein AB7V50_01120 [Vampirovibrionia bacterium]